ncbi:unnamed protein product [Peniophora sp. CBMAI 1063]|nr:unnamed protein product [Peniophora sp. CBMAI 1063]
MSLLQSGLLDVTQFYFNHWTSPVLAFVIFGLFGITSEARASFWRIICTVGGWFGWQPKLRVAHRLRLPLGDIEFGERPAENSMSLGLEYAHPSNPSYIDPNARAQGQVLESRGSRSGDTMRSKSEKDVSEEVHRSATCSDAERAAQPYPAGSHEGSFGDASVVV